MVFSDKSSVLKEEDEPFLLNYMIIADSLNTDEQNLKIVMFIRRLPSNLSLSKNIKVGVGGISRSHSQNLDRTLTFHPYALANVTVLVILLSCSEPWKPTISSEALIYCWAIQARPLLPVLHGCLESQLWESSVFFTFSRMWNIISNQWPKTGPTSCRCVNADIHSLQLCKDATTFSAAASLFIKIWQTTHPDLVTYYFKAQWLDKNYAQYEDAAGIEYPSTNNGQEATNSVIKRENTLPERLPVGQFLNSIVDLVSS